MTETFDPAFFEMLKKAEQSHFWFRVRRNWIFDFLRKYKSPHCKILEVGCGTGNVSSYLAEKNHDVIGCEYYKEALDMAWPGFLKTQGSATALPFMDKSFDVVGLFDVIEHFEDETPLLKEAQRVLKKDGIIIITVPARQELWSYIDDQSFHKRRYAVDDMKAVLTKSGFKPVSVQYMFMLLYLPMKFLRNREGRPGDFLKISSSFNSLARLLFECERLMSRFMGLPVGTSIISVAVK
jgi:ubiquinone/menaquinone biosynthesis C-methylase UbiE